MNYIKTKKGLTVLEAMVVGGILSGVALFTVGTIFTNAQNNAALIAYEGSMKKVRTAIYVCGMENAPVLLSGSEGIAICASEEKFPVLSERCGDVTPSYQIKRDGPSWELTTVRADDADKLWYCQGCNIACTADECTYNERERGACQKVK